MTAYAAPLPDMRFVLEHVAGLDAVASLPGYGSSRMETVGPLLESGARFYERVWAPTNRPADLAGSTLRDGHVVVLDALHDAYRQTVAGGWTVLPREPQPGEDGVPWLLHAAIIEMAASSNGSFSMLTGLISGAIELLQAYASDDLKALYVPKLFSGEWAGAMDLSEPGAGSNLGALVTRAVPQPDGTYRLHGVKRFISWGEHDLAENIVHLVLARTPGAPAGTAGISCFLVSKFLVGSGGSLGERNDIRCVSVEQNLGFRASPTCVMALGDEGGAVAHLIGAEHGGMRIMFTLMNSNRLATAIGALGISVRAYQAARAYARERVQGVPHDRPEGTPIVEHADVRRMLMTMRSLVEAMRSLCYLTAAALDHGAHAPDPAVRAEWRQLANLLTPIAKAWCSDMGIEVTSLAIQIFGGAGWVEESGVAQLYRDVRVLSIFEGTNGIQAQDLVGRKIGQADGRLVDGLLARMRALAAELDAAGGSCAVIARGLVRGVDALRKGTDWMRAQGAGLPLPAASGATAYQRLFGGVLGAYLLGTGALAAHRARAAGDTRAFTPAFLDAKIATARFYVEHVLPLAVAALAPATAGADAIYGIAAEEL